MNEAVILLAYGGPDDLADLPAYLLHVRGGRPTPPDLLAEIAQRYARIGGRSPLLAITRSTAAQLSATVGLPVYVGMRHWKPSIASAVQQMAEDGVQRCVAICMAPHYSRLSIGAYRTTLEEAAAAAGRGLAVAFVDHWHEEPAYLDGLAASVSTALLRFDRPGQAKVIFTAHSLPQSILAEGDPYDAQLEQTARAVAERIGLPPDRWTRCYQSAASTGTPWLGPAIEELVPALVAAGERAMVVAPIGFLADQVEVLYDLDINLQAIAASLGARLERAPMLNDSPALVAALASLVDQRLPSLAARIGQS